MFFDRTYASAQSEEKQKHSHGNDDHSRDQSEVGCGDFIIVFVCREYPGTNIEKARGSSLKRDKDQANEPRILKVEPQWLPYLLSKRHYIFSNKKLLYFA